MERRIRTVLENVKQTIADNGTTEEIVAQAADLSQRESEQLQGTQPLELSVLAKVGGLLRSPISSFLKGVA